MRHFIGILTILALALASSEAMAKTDLEKAQAFCANPTIPKCIKMCKGWNMNAKSDGEVISACETPPPKKPWCPLHETRHTNRAVHPCPDGQHVVKGKCVPNEVTTEGEKVVEPTELSWLENLGPLLLNNLLLLILFMIWWRRQKRSIENRTGATEENSTKINGQLYELIRLLEERPMIDDDATAEELLARLKARCVIPAMTEEGEEFQKNLLPK